MSLIESNNLRTEFEVSRYSDGFCAEHHIDRSISLEMVDIILTKAEKNGIKSKFKSIIGKWIQKYQNDGGWHSPDYWDHMYKCSECGSDGSNHFNFCPKCGLPMNDKALEILVKRLSNEEWISAKKDNNNSRDKYICPNCGGNLMGKPLMCATCGYEQKR